MKSWWGGGRNLICITWVANQVKEGLTGHYFQMVKYVFERVGKILSRKKNNESSAITREFYPRSRANASPVKRVLP
jgi:hypothetical protein